MMDESAKDEVSPVNSGLSEGRLAMIQIEHLSKIFKLNKKQQKELKTKETTKKDVYKRQIVHRVNLSLQKASLSTVSVRTAAVRLSMQRRRLISLN